MSTDCSSSVGRFLPSVYKVNNLTLYMESVNFTIKATVFVTNWVALWYMVFDKCFS